MPKTMETFLPLCEHVPSNLAPQDTATFGALLAMRSPQHALRIQKLAQDVYAMCGLHAAKVRGRRPERNDRWDPRFPLEQHAQSDDASVLPPLGFDTTAICRT